MAHTPIDQAQQVGQRLSAKGWSVATAESCTGGLIGHYLTEIAGSSAYFLGGVIAYSNAVKEHELAVPAAILAAHGAVSEPTARSMAGGVRQRIGSDVGVATTGIAGPGGGTDAKPVGLVFVCVETPETSVCQRFVFGGDRGQVKQQAARAAFQLLLNMLH